MIFNIQRCSIHDGEGLRTLVFFKGCPLRCAWCANPESQSYEREIMESPIRCVGCGACRQVCPSGAVTEKVYYRQRKVRQMLQMYRCMLRRSEAGGRQRIYLRGTHRRDRKRQAFLSSLWRRRYFLGRRTSHPRKVFGSSGNALQAEGNKCHGRIMRIWEP